MREGRSRPISKLQSAAPEVVREARRAGVVAITRYGRPVAYLVSPEERRQQEELAEAANRALWAIDIERALRDLRERRAVSWVEAVKALRTELPGR